MSDMSDITAIPASLSRPTSQPLASSRHLSRFRRYMLGHAWAHLLLLAGIALFLFPFVYMFATSLKTDEELTETGWFPSIPQFTPSSSHVRAASIVPKPAEAPQE